MTTRRPFWIFLCAALALAACDPSGNPPTSADGGDAPAAGASFTAGEALSCDVRDARAFARDYFGQPERRDVDAILRELDDALDDGDVDRARDLGFDVLAATEAVAAASAGGGSGEGSALVNAVLACMDVGHEAAVDFSGALVLFGAFGVRGGADDPAFAPVLARGSVPQWGGEPAGGASWPTVLDPTPGVELNPGERRLLHATPLSSTGFTDEVPVSSAYQWGMVPDPSLVPLAGELAVGACLPEPDPRLRVQRSVAILPFEALSFCDAAAAASSPFPGARIAARSPLRDRGGPAGAAEGLVERLAGLARSILAPRPLGASSAVFGGVGGRLSSFSPVVVVDAGAVNLAFGLQPTDVPVDEPFPVEITARGNGGTPLPEVTVRLEIEGNNASFGKLTYHDEDGLPLDAPPVVATGVDGVASFRVSLNKPGGFRLTATGDLFGFEAASVTSGLFHVAP